MNNEKLKGFLAGKNLSALSTSPKPRQMVSIRAYYNIPAKEEILAIIDATVFGSAKNGLAVTGKGIYWHNDFMTPTPFTYLSYADLQKSEILFKKYDVEFSGGGVFDTAAASSSAQEIARFLEELKNFTSDYLNEAEAEENSFDEPSIETATPQRIHLPSLQAYASSWNVKDIIISPEGPKVEAAKVYYEIPENDEIYAIIDATTFGSAKNGLAVTSSGIYWNNGFTQHTAYKRLLHDELAETDMQSGWMCIKFANGGHFDCSSSNASTKKIFSFLQGVKELAQGKRLDELTIILPEKTKVDSTQKSGKNLFNNSLGTKVNGLINNIGINQHDQWDINKAQPLETEFYSFNQANKLARQLIDNSDALQDENSEIWQTNKAIVRISIILDEIDAKFREADVKDGELQNILEASSQKNFAIAKRLTDKNFYVGIFGEFSTGKSTFINAMLEERFLIEDSLRGTTCSQTTIKYSPDENITVIFNNDTYLSMRNKTAKGPIKDRTKAKEFLRAMTAEEEKAKNIREVIWETPIGVLNNGLSIIDTPGISSLNPRHTEVAQTAAKGCDALLVLTDLNNSLSKELLTGVKDIAGEQAANCIFIGTRKDNIQIKELPRQRKHFQKRLTSNFGHECQFEFVSAYTALEALAKGGGPALDEFRAFRIKIKQLLESNRQFIQGRKAAVLINELAAGIAENFDKKVSEFEQQIAEYENSIVKTDAVQWDNWGEDEKGRFKLSGTPIKAEALEAATGLTDKIFATIKNRINACKDNSDLKTYLETGIKKTFESYAREIQQLPKKAIEKPLEKAFSDAKKSYGKRFKEEYKKIEEIFGMPVIRAKAIKSNNSEKINIAINNSGISALHKDMDSEENVKIGGGLATGIALSMLVPGVGWVIGGALTFLGGVVGAGLLKSLDKRKSEALDKVQDAIWEYNKTLRSEMEKYYTNIFKEAANTLEAYIKDQKKEYVLTIDNYNKMLERKKINLANVQAFIKSTMPELNDIANKMNEHKQKEYFVFTEAEVVTE